MAEDSENQRIAEAHTRADRQPEPDAGQPEPRDLEPDPDQAAKIGDQAAVAQTALDDLARQIEPEDEPPPPDLFDDEQSLFAGPIKHVAETFERAKGRGRPKGSKNKANQTFRNYLAARGNRHPGLVLADVASADPLELSKELGCKPGEALALILSAADKLLPYVESKRPTEEIRTEQQLHYLIIDNTGFSQTGADDDVLSITGEVREKTDKSDT